jgi:hypothetical protein
MVGATSPPMLKISAVQQRKLDQIVGERVYAKFDALAFELRPDLRTRVTPEVLRRFIDAVREQASGLGFSTEFEQAVFFSAVLLQGRDFHLNPQHPLHEVVHRPDVEPRLRANQLLYELERLGAVSLPAS